MKIIPIGAKVKYEYDDISFTGTVHGHYINNDHLFYSIFLGKKYQTYVDLDESAMKVFLSVIVCHSGCVFELKE